MHAVGIRKLAAFFRNYSAQRRGQDRGIFSCDQRLGGGFLVGFRETQKDASHAANHFFGELVGIVPEVPSGKGTRGPFQGFGCFQLSSCFVMRVGFLVVAFRTVRPRCLQQKHKAFTNYFFLILLYTINDRSPYFFFLFFIVFSTGGGGFIRI